MPNMVTEFLFLRFRIFKKLQRKGFLKSLSPSYKFNRGNGGESMSGGVEGQLGDKDTCNT